MANENTTSLDLPPALASLLNMQMPAVPQTPTPGLQTGLTSAVGIGPQQMGGGMQTGLPSFQEGGYIGGFGPEVLTGADRQQRMFGSTTRKPLINYADPFTKTLLERVRDNPGSMPDSFYKGMIESQSPGLFSGIRAPAGGAYGGGTGGGLGLGDPTTYFPNALNPDRKKPTVTVEEIPQTEVKDNSYAEGGMVGMEGMRVPPGAVPGMPMAGVAPAMDTESPMDPQMMQMQINQVASRNPQALAEIRNAIMEELQSGDLTPQELNTIIQLTQVAANNPEMYPYVKQFAMQQGLAAAGDLPDKFDQGLIMVLLLAARAVQQDIGGAPAEMGQPPGSAAPVIPSMAKGGMLPSSGKSEPVIIEAHTGEYVIPKHVVDMKGKEFFDSLVEKYKDKK